MQLGRVRRPRADPRVRGGRDRAVGALHPRLPDRGHHGGARLLQAVHAREAAAHHRLQPERCRKPTGQEA